MKKTHTSEYKKHNNNYNYTLQT